MESKSKVEQFCEEHGLEGCTYFSDDEYYTAIVGYTDDGRLIYDFDLMVEFLMERDGSSYDEAVEWIEYNTIRSLPYFQNSPVIMYSSKIE